MSNAVSGPDNAASCNFCDCSLRVGDHAGTDLAVSVALYVLPSPAYLRCYMVWYDCFCANVGIACRE